MGSKEISLILETIFFLNHPLIFISYYVKLFCFRCYKPNVFGLKLKALIKESHKYSSNDIPGGRWEAFWMRYGSSKLEIAKKGVIMKIASPSSILE